MRSEDWYRQHCNAPLLTAEQETQLGRQIQAWLQHPDGSDACPAIVKRRGLRARDRMVQSNVRLVFSVLRRFRIAEADWDDMIQEGIIGLQRAAEKFDPARGYKFSTYAYWWIRQGIQRSHATCRLIKLPTDYGDVLRAVARCRDRLLRETGAAPSLAKIAQELGLSDHDLLVLNTTAADCVSLQTPSRQVDDPGCTMETMIADERDAPLDAMQKMEVRELINKALTSFEPWQREVIDAAWGLNGEKLRTVAQLARDFNQKPPRIKGLLTMARHYLRVHLRPLATDELRAAMITAPELPTVESPYITVQPLLPMLVA